MKSCKHLRWSTSSSEGPKATVLLGYQDIGEVVPTPHLVWRNWDHGTFLQQIFHRRSTRGTSGNHRVCHVGASHKQVPDESLERMEVGCCTLPQGRSLKSDMRALLPLPVVGLDLSLAAQMGLLLLGLASLLTGTLPFDVHLSSSLWKMRSGSAHSGTGPCHERAAKTFLGLGRQTA